MVVLAIAWEDWVSDVELGHDATEGPHVDGAVVGDAEHDLGCPVESRLDVGVDTLIQESRASKVDDLDPRLVGLFQEDILRLKVTVDDLEHLEVLEGVEQLNCEATDEVVVKSLQQKSHKRGVSK